jgi:hypothetical protein
MRGRGDFGSSSLFAPIFFYFAVSEGPEEMYINHADQERNK